MADVADLQLALQADAGRYTLPCFLEDVCSLHGERVALVGENAALNFDELRAGSRALARGLVAAGVGKGTRVALLMGNGPAWVEAMFAVAMTGGVLVPVNTFATPDEREYILAHSDSAVLLMQESLAGNHYLDEMLARYDQLRESQNGSLRIPDLPLLRSVYCHATASMDALLTAGSIVNDGLLDQLSAEVTPADEAMIIYTSGTTARPKGVLHEHRAPVVQSWRFAEYMALDDSDRVLTAQPFFWTAGIAMSLGASLAAGARLYTTEVFDPATALATIEREKITTLHAWPHQEKSMAEHDAAASHDLSSLRYIEFSSPLAPLAGLNEDRWGTYGAYGLSETFTVATSLPASAPAELRSATSGAVLPGNQLKIVDPDSGAALADGERGEIILRAATMMRGYYKVERELVFDRDGWFHTGDGGWIDDDGLLRWTGRLTGLVKTGGANVSPAEVEEVAAGFAGLKTSAALGLPHPSLGEALVLVAVPVDGSELDGEQLRAWLRERLSAYKVPRAVVVLAPHEAEYTGSSKLKVEPLKELALSRLSADGGTDIAGHRYTRR